MTNKIISMLAALSLMSVPAMALELPNGAKKVSDQEAIGIFVNKKLSLTLYDNETGKKVGSGTLEHRADGIKAVDIIYKGKKIKRDLKWWIKGNRLCAGSIGQGKTVCGTEGALYRKGNTCYNMRNGRLIDTKFKC